MRIPVVAVLLSSFLGGCAATPVGIAPGGYVGAYPVTNPVGVPMSIKVDIARALAALPPEAGPVLSVQETRHPNGLTQEIVLGSSGSAAGANGLSLVELMPPDPAWRGDSEGALKLPAITDTAIQADLDKQFPHVAMRIAATYETTAQGPLGVATGKSGSTTCLYAWQNLTPARPLTVLEGAAGLGDYPISVRVRLCKAMSEATLLDLVRRLTVVRPGLGPVYASAGPIAGPVGGDALAAAGGAAVVAPVGYAQPAYAVAATPYAPVVASPALLPAPVAMAATTGGPVVVGGPVQVSPLGVVVAPPVLSGTDPMLATAYGAPVGYGVVPAYNVPTTAGVALSAPRRTVRVARAHVRRTRFVARRVTPAMLEDRASGPLVPLPGEMAPPPAALPLVAPRAPVRAPPLASEDALPLPR